MLDTSALAKLLVEEAESAFLRAELSRLAGSAEPMVVSTIATVELRRLAIRLGVDQDKVEPVLRPFTVLRLTEGVLHLASRIPAQHLGTLDALHIATALTVEADRLLTYDDRQAAAAVNEGLTILRPDPASP
nr:type II toxin-antitoxin system VapC family toxin [Kocuria subflava]